MVGRPRTQVIALAAALCGLFACGSDGAAPDPQALRDCDEIASRCHRYWQSSKTAEACHDLGHAPGDPKVCSSRKAECLAICPETDGGHSHHPDDAAPPAADAPPDRGAPDATPVDPEKARTCTDYCACMRMTCTSKTAAPFSTAEACLAACLDYTDAERKCWASFCSLAASGVSEMHNCDHAAGELGLDECE
jgi:hypothetical protein